MSTSSWRIDSTLGDRLRDILAEDQCVRDLARYFDTKPTKGRSAQIPAYSGAWFERLGGGGDRPAIRNNIEAEDILAVSFLSVSIPPLVAWKILIDQRGEISNLLEKIPADIPLWEADESDLGPGSAADNLWHLLYTLDEEDDLGRRWVTAGKLLARKRPHLIPVYDRRVKAQVGLTRGASWRLSLRTALQSEDIRARLADLHRGAGLPAEIGLLRTLDVILWMRDA